MNAWPRWSVGVALAALSVGHASALPAQAIRGQVVLPDSTTPAVGAIAIAMDGRDRAVGRALTNVRGQFVLALPFSGSYVVRVLRIGYHPTDVAARAVGVHDTASVRIVLNARPVTLATVNVREQETCSVGADTGLAVARVWEEARKAMLTSQLHSDDAPLLAEWVEYDRSYDASGRSMRSQQIRVARHPTSHAFRSLPATVLDSSGYVTTDTAGINFYAPDADALLSEAFVTGHCFRLAPVDSANSGLVGVTFQPARGHLTKREIQGTLWVDRRTAELRTLEYRYTNLPEAATSAGAGGNVEFLKLPDGNWLVSRWNIRMPNLAPVGRTSADGLRRTLMTRTGATVRSIQTTGGEVTKVTRGESVVYARNGPAVNVQVTSNDRSISVSHATLSLDGTDYAATGDELGRIRIGPVLPGRYHARIRTMLMDSLEVPSIEADVDALDDGVANVVRMFDGRGLVATVCGDMAHGSAGLLHGGAVDRHARGLSHVKVVASWQADSAAAGTVRTGTLDFTQNLLGTTTDEDGLWRICGAPHGIPVTVRIDADSGVAARTVTLGADQPFLRVPLAIDYAAALAQPLPSAARAVVEVSVASADGAAVGGVSLEFQPATGPARTLVTSPGGKALLADVAAGPLTVRARRIGFRQGEVATQLVPGRNAIALVMSAASTPTLDTMRAVASRTVLARHDEFEVRRRSGAAVASFNRDDIERRNPTAIWEMLWNVNSMHLADRDDGVAAVSTRTMMKNFGGGPCFMAVMVDGVPVPRLTGHEYVDLRQLPPPDEIHGVEVFSGPANVPVQYGGIGEGKVCGLIAIWTR